MKKYKVVISSRAIKALNKLDRPIKALLFAWIKENLEGCVNPRFSGKALAGQYKNLWRYRVGDYRIIADIQDSEIRIVIVNVGHRREIYR